MWLPLSMRCNGYPNCPQGDDEVNCPGMPVLPPAASQPPFATSNQIPQGRYMQPQPQSSGAGLVKLPDQFQQRLPMNYADYQGNIDLG